MNDLLPCPFCGDAIADPEPADVGWWVECIKCEIVMDRDSKNDLIKSWNTRPPLKLPMID